MPIITIEETNLNILTGEVTVTTREIQESTLVPQALTPRQARLVLLSVGLLDEIEAMVASDRAMQIWWEYSLEIGRNNEHILSAKTALGLSDEQLDNLFIEGAKL